MPAPMVKVPKANRTSQALPVQESKLPQNRPGLPGSGPAEQPFAPQRTIGDQAVLRISAKGRQNSHEGTFADALLALQRYAGNYAVDQFIAARSTARPLPPLFRREMEARLGTDLQSVRVHDDAAANQQAASLGAKAVTVGEDIVFGYGHFAPDSMAGRELIAHELAHVVQQRRGGTTVPRIDGQGPLEAEAGRVADALAVGGGPVSVGGASAVGLAAEPEEGKDKKKTESTNEAVTPETGDQFEERVLAEGRAAREAAKSERYFPYEGGKTGSIRGFLNKVEGHYKDLQRGGYKGAKAPPVNRKILDQTREEFIRNNPRLAAHWQKELKALHAKLRQVFHEHRAADGDRKTQSRLLARQRALEQRLERLDKWGQGEVGALRQDLVEISPPAKRIEITDITQRPFDPSHNFKSELYGEVYKELYGWDDVRVVEYRSPLTQKPLPQSSSEVKQSGKQAAQIKADSPTQATTEAQGKPAKLPALQKPTAGITLKTPPKAEVSAQVPSPSQERPAKLPALQKPITGTTLETPPKVEVSAKAPSLPQEKLAKPPASQDPTIRPRLRNPQSGAVTAEAMSAIATWGLEGLIQGKLIYDESWEGLVKHNLPPPLQGTGDIFDVVRTVSNSNTSNNADQEAKGKAMWNIAKGTAGFVSGPLGATIVGGAEKISEKPSVYGTFAALSPINFYNFVVGKDIYDFFFD